MHANDRLFTLKLNSSKTDPFRRGISLKFLEMITRLSHFPVKGEGVDQLCLLCAEKHSSNKKANPNSNVW